LNVLLPDPELVFEAWPLIGRCPSDDDVQSAARQNAVMAKILRICKQATFYRTR